MRVVELFEVTQLVNDDVVGKMNWKFRDAIVEIQIPLSRTAPPTRPLVSDRNPLVVETIMLIEYS